jgi:hypothetical protein
LKTAAKRVHFRGPFILSDRVIDQEVTNGRPGAFVCGSSDDVANFRIAFVGSSETDVNNQLHLYVGAYQRFGYEYCSSAQEVFEKACGFYHDFEPYDNPVHPVRPKGTAWKCPRCKLLG